MEYDTLKMTNIIISLLVWEVVIIIYSENVNIKIQYAANNPGVIRRLYEAGSFKKEFYGHFWLLVFSSL